MLTNINYKNPSLKREFPRSPLGDSSLLELGFGRSPAAQTLEHTSLSEDFLELKNLKKLAGVKSPSLFKRIAQVAGNWLTGVKIALAIAPTVGSLVLAKEMATMQSKMTGSPQMAPIDWLRENRPSDFVSSLGAVMNASSSTLQSAVGLSLSDLTAVEEHYYRAMAPSLNEDGIKSTAPFLRELAKEPFEAPGHSRSAFVFLGEKDADTAKSVTDLWNSPHRPPTNPFSSDDQRAVIWDTLQADSSQGHLPIFVDIDGDYTTFTGTEFVAKKTLASLGERNNSLGDDFADTGRYFAWLTQRQESYSKDLAPYFASQDPTADSLVSKIKSGLTPPWLDGSHGMGPLADPKRMREVIGMLSDIRENSSDSSWLDSLVSLDRDVLTGVQTHWIKLLHEVTRTDREAVLGPLPAEFFELNLRAPSEQGFADVAPADGPELKELVPNDALACRTRPYDRSVSLKEILEHSLDGLGIQERRTMLGDIDTLAEQHLPKLESREQRLRTELGEGYGGLDIKKVLDGSISPENFKNSVQQLKEISDQKSRTPVGQEARRHASMLEFLYEMDHRYAEADRMLPRISGDFSQHPFGVSEFFVPPAAGTAISPLRETEKISVKMGNAQASEPTKMSLVLEGGGGRGFAYVECLKQLESGFVNSKNGYEIDEYIGTSAGSIVALLLAAGYQGCELKEVMAEIDFTSFNGDAAWLRGGVDPKVRGIDRTGLFSTQKMYQTFSELLSKKLGVEGRPVLFSDLPHKLKLVSCLNNTDLAHDSTLRGSLDQDGRYTFSTDSTPNFDVVGALVSSAAVPGFFQLPQMLVARPHEDGTLERSRMQMGDGGMVDNLSISSASRKEKDRALIVLPAHTQTRHPVTGEWVGLDTLNFSTDNLDLVDAHNRELYAKFAPKLDDYLQKMKGNGVERAVIAFNLAKPSQQPLPAVQGSSEHLSLHAIIHAKDLELPVLSKEKGDAFIKASLRPPSLVGNVVAGLFDRYIDNRPGVGDGSGDFHRSEDGFHYRPSSREMTDVFEMGWSVGGAILAAGKSEYQERKFEK